MRTTINIKDELMDALEDLISLSGKIDIDLDWQKEEEAELNEYRDHNTTLRSDNRVRSAFWRP